MFYRLDYAFAVLALGLVVGLLLGGRVRALPPSKLARRYYAAVAFLLIVRTLIFALSMIAPRDLWSSATGLSGDLVSVLFGALFGLAIRHSQPRKLLTEPAAIAALLMQVSFTFGIAGTAKAFQMTPMTEFFTQSGYSTGFLKFIVIAEIFGAIGLLLPWAAVPALIGFAVDMFGAVLTHVHNRDPWNDSTGAVVMIVRLAVIGVLYNMRSREDKPSVSIRSSILKVAAAAAICFSIALGGSVVMRHRGPSVPALFSLTAR